MTQTIIDKLERADGPDRELLRAVHDLRMKAHWGKNYDTSLDAWPNTNADWRQTPHGAPWDSNVHMAKFSLALAEQIAALRARSQGGE